MNSTYTAFIVRLLPGHVNSNSTFECAIFNRDSQTTEVSNSYVVYVTNMTAPYQVRNYTASSKFHLTWEHNLPECYSGKVFFNISANMYSESSKENFAMTEENAITFEGLNPATTYMVEILAFLGNYEEVKASLSLVFRTADAITLNASSKEVCFGESIKLDCNFQFNIPVVNVTLTVLSLQKELPPFSQNTISFSESRLSGTVEFSFNMTGSTDVADYGSMYNFSCSVSFDDKNMLNPAAENSEFTTIKALEIFPPTDLEYTIGIKELYLTWRHITDCPPSNCNFSYEVTWQTHMGIMINGGQTTSVTFYNYNLDKINFTEIPLTLSIKVIAFCMERPNVRSDEDNIMVQLPSESSQGSFAVQKLLLATAILLQQLFYLICQ